MKNYESKSNNILSDKSEKEILLLSLHTTDIEEQKLLLKSPYSNIRRNLALNPNVPTDIINELCEDPVVNVSFIATQHKNSTIKRTFRKEDSTHKCITCDLDPLYEKCNDCNSKKLEEESKPKKLKTLKSLFRKIGWSKQ